MNAKNGWEDQSSKMETRKTVCSSKCPLTEIKCPECDANHPMKKLQLKVKIGFGCLTWQVCRAVNIASKWRCRCNILWYKCPVHVHEKVMAARTNMLTMRSTGSSSKRCRGECIDPERGVDRPMPKYRRTQTGHACTAHEPIIQHAFIKRDSILGARFPHLVRNVEAEDG